MSILCDPSDVTAVMRTTAGVNKAEPSAQGAGKSVPPMGCSESSERRWQVTPILWLDPPGDLVRPQVRQYLI